MDWIAVGLPILAAVIAWASNEWRKQALDERLRREERYRFLLEHSRGFYVATENEDDQARFLQEVNLSWLYCPDRVIRAMYAFLEGVHTDAPSDVEEAESAFDRMVLEMRKDLRRVGPWQRTNLTASDYRHFAPAETIRAARERQGRGFISAPNNSLEESGDQSSRPLRQP